MQNTKQVLDGDNKDIFKRKREFYLDEDLVDKIDSIEYGAQVNKIEEIEVNGVPVEPDESKTVKLKIPRVINAVTSDSESDALSAAMGKYLYTLITEGGGGGGGGSYTAGNGISISGNVISNTLPGAVVSATAPSNPTKGMIWYDTTNDELKTYDGSQWNVTGKEYNTGPGIEIGTINDYSAMRGPCSEGFHVPSKDELVALCGILTTTFGLENNGNTIKTYLKMPYAGRRHYSNSNIGDQGNWASYISSTTTGGDVYYLYAGASILNPQATTYRAEAYTIRPFKDIAVIPDNNWTTLYAGTGDAGIFHNPTLGLISISSDGTDWTTISDKNLGATTVYNNGDALSESNCGGYFQRGNNYMFPFTGTVTTSSTQVNANTYGPGNYYYSNVFITISGSPYDHDRSSIQNDNLRGGDTGIVTIENAISNTGVLSVNGQTGHVEIAEGNTKTFFLNGSQDIETAQAAADWLAAGGNPIINYNDVSFILTDKVLYDNSAQ